MSKGIKSDITMASARATSLNSATNTLKQTTSVDKDHQTTVRGNEKAFGAITEAHQTAMSIANAINGSANQLKTVASNFEADDAQASRTMFKNTLGMKK